MANPTPVRLATTTTGARYIVIRVDLRDDIVVCWGEVSSYTGFRTVHRGKLEFRRADVIVGTVPRTLDLMRELFVQGTKAYVASLPAGRAIRVTAPDGAAAREIADAARDAGRAASIGGRKTVHVGA